MSEAHGDISIRNTHWELLVDNMTAGVWFHAVRCHRFKVQYGRAAAPSSTFNTHSAASAPLTLSLTISATGRGSPSHHLISCAEELASVVAEMGNVV